MVIHFATTSSCVALRHLRSDYGATTVGCASVNNTSLTATSTQWRTASEPDIRDRNSHLTVFYTDA